jgi:hypothetical protein
MPQGVVGETDEGDGGVSNKHRGQRASYRPSFEDFFPKTARGATRRDRAEDGAGRQKNIDDWNEERGLNGRSTTSVAIEATAIRRAA